MNTSTVVNTAEVNSEYQGYTTTGVYKRHDGQYVYITITDDEGSTDIEFAHVHANPASLTTMLKGRTVTVHTTTVMGYHVTNTITW